MEKMTVQTLEKEFKTTPHAVETSEARWLYTHLPPLPIQNEKDHVLYKRVVDVLMEEGKTGGDYHAYLDAVIHFLDEYEKERVPDPRHPGGRFAFSYGTTRFDAERPGRRVGRPIGCFGNFKRKTKIDARTH
jgi:hypothetical protein